MSPSESWRRGNEKEQLLVSFIKPHKEVVKNTVDPERTDKFCSI